MIDVGRICMNTINLLSVAFSLGFEWPLQHAGIFLPIVVININILHIFIYILLHGQRNCGCHRWKKRSARLHCHTAPANMQTSCAIWICVWIYTNKAKVTNIETKLKLQQSWDQSTICSNSFWFRRMQELDQASVSSHCNEKINQKYIFIALRI